MNNEKDPDRIAYKKAWREAHREQERASQRNAYAKWRKENPLPPKVLVEKKEKVRRVPKDRSNKRDGLSLVVYVIRAGDYSKVGIAENVISRVSGVRTHCPLPVVLAYCSKPMLRPEARRLEVACHRHLAGNRIHGEWFKCHSDDAVRHLKHCL